MVSKFQGKCAQEQKREKDVPVSRLFLDLRDVARRCVRQRVGGRIRLVAERPDKPRVGRIQRTNLEANGLFVREFEGEEEVSFLFCFSVLPPHPLGPLKRVHTGKVCS